MSLAPLAGVLVLVAALIPASPVAAGPTSAQLRDAESLVLTRMNEERAVDGLRALRMDGRVRAVAQARSADMAERDYFSHVDPDGHDPWYHLGVAGIGYSAAGEIIASNGVGPIRDAARMAVQQWMHSQGHHDLIMDTQWDFNYAGVGVALDGGVSYWTVVFIQGPDRTDPRASLTSATSTAGTRAARIHWSGTDPLLVTRTAGVGTFDVQRRRSGGSWATVRSRVTGTAASITGTRGVRYQFRVRARDRAGNVGEWSPTRSVTVR
jgi:uncharacterized protein YkwD